MCGARCSIWQFCPIWLEMLKLGKLYISHNQIKYIQFLHSQQMETSKLFNHFLFTSFLCWRSLDAWYFNKGPVVTMTVKSGSHLYSLGKVIRMKYGFSSTPPLPRLKIIQTLFFSWAIYKWAPDMLAYENNTRFIINYMHWYFTKSVCSQINLIGGHLKFERFAALRYCFLIPRIVSLTFKQGYKRVLSLQKYTHRSTGQKNSDFRISV